MSGRCCNTCVYCVFDREDWLRSQCMGESAAPKCANHPRWPGVVHEVPTWPRLRQNPNIEIRNPRQIRRTEIPMFQTPVAQPVLSLGHWNIRACFEFRYSGFVHHLSCGRDYVGTML